MAYTRHRVKLTGTGFPLLSEFSGRSVVIPDLDENKGTITEPNKEIANIYYCENVLPTNEGYRSISFTKAIDPIELEVGTYLANRKYTYGELKLITYADMLDTVATATELGLHFTRIFEVRDSDSKTYIGICANGIVWIYDIPNSRWKTLNVTGWNGEGEVTTAVVLLATGITTFICIAGFALYTVDIVNLKLDTPELLGGIDTTTILGITSAFNYLIFHNGRYIQWSSAFNPLDFDLTLAIESGTGFGIPSGIRGIITALSSNPAGFLVYTTSNAVDVRWSGNIQFPWVFTPVPNSAGIDSSENVVNGLEGVNYSWTNAGLQQVSAAKADAIFPEVTDFLSGSVLELYNHTQRKVLVSDVADINVAISFLGSRYFVISYGKVLPSTGLPKDLYQYCLVYDSALQRWGKLAITHASAIGLNLASPKAGDPKKDIGFLLGSGEVQVVNFDAHDFTADAVFMFGKIALTRKTLTTIQGVLVDNVGEGNTNFTLSIATTLDGKELQFSLNDPVARDMNSTTRDYLTRVTGVNHVLLLGGSFNLNSIEITSSVAGRR